MNSLRRRRLFFLQDPKDNGKTTAHLVQLLDHHLEPRPIALLEFLAQFDEDIPIRRLLEQRLAGDRDDWLHVDSPTPLGRLRRLGLVHVGLHTVDGRDFVFVGLAREIDAVVSDRLSPPEPNGVQLRLNTERWCRPHSGVQRPQRPASDRSAFQCRIIQRSSHSTLFPTP